MGDVYDLNVHVWPDKQVIRSVDSETETELRNQRKRPSGEIIPDVPLPTNYIHSTYLIYIGLGQSLADTGCCSRIDYCHALKPI